MRSSCGGGLAHIRASGMSSDVSTEDRKAKKDIVFDLHLRPDETIRESKSAAPTHKATTTNAYSLSFPVWSVLSHLSNTSTRGHAMLTSNTIVAMISDRQDRVGSTSLSYFAGMKIR